MARRENGGALRGGWRAWGWRRGGAAGWAGRVPHTEKGTENVNGHGQAVEARRRTPPCPSSCIGSSSQVMSQQKPGGGP